MLRRALVAVVTVVTTGATALAMVAASAPATVSRASGTRLGDCPVFPANNIWNTRIDNLPRHPRSRQWLARMSPRSDLHPDFGPSGGVPYGIPITRVGEHHRRVKVTFRYAGESDHVRYPLGHDTRIEGGRRSTGDRHAIVVDTDRCRLYETFSTRRINGKWRAGSGAVWRLRSNRLRPDGWTSADAAGLPILPGLLRYREVEVVGRVTHAIRFTTDRTTHRHLWPARHDAGSRIGAEWPPMGARFRLRPGFSFQGYRRDTRVVLRAMQRYGLVLADNGSPWFFQGEAHRGWPVGLLDELKTIPARAFVAVDVRSLKRWPNSGAAG